MYMSMCGNVQKHVGVRRGQKRALHSLELVSHLIWVMGAQLRFFARIECTHNLWSMSLVPHLWYFMVKKQTKQQHQHKRKAYTKTSIACFLSTFHDVIHIFPIYGIFTSSNLQIYPKLYVIKWGGSKRYFWI